MSPGPEATLSKRASWTANVIKEPQLDAQDMDPTSPACSVNSQTASAERNFSIVSVEDDRSERRGSNFTAPSSVCPDDLEDEKENQPSTTELKGKEKRQQLEGKDTTGTRLESNTPEKILQPVEYASPYSHPSMPWDRFYSSRPAYPASMFDLWLSYHAGPLATVHDLGAGSGLAADGLLTAARTYGLSQMPHTILSDPGRSNLEIAARFMTARHPYTTIDCWQARGEDQAEFLPPGSLDMAICAEALHWMDIPAVVDLVAESLREGGTFAVVLYSCFPRIQNNARVKALLRRFVEEHLQRGLLLGERNRVTDAEGVEMHENWKRGLRNLAYGLDSVELSAETWEDVKRYA